TPRSDAEQERRRGATPSRSDAEERERERERETVSVAFLSSLFLLSSFFLSLSAHTLPWIKLSGQGLGIQPSDNYEMLVALGKDQFVIKKTRIDSLYGLVNLMDAALAAAPRIQIPALVLYGAKDEIIPKSATGRMLSSLTNSPRIIIYPDGYHMLLRDLGGSVVLADISAWIMDPNMTLPSNLSTDWKSFFTE
ncbi:MAG: hypothetical protein CMM34_09695, partial [Rhodospirillaceae bacterium]|nr:hypothetical protein [Rhodospirillaceae bacterium]